MTPRDQRAAEELAEIVARHPGLNDRELRRVLKRIFGTARGFKRALHAAVALRLIDVADYGFVARPMVFSPPRLVRLVRTPALLWTGWDLVTSDVLEAIQRMRHGSAVAVGGARC